MVDEQARLAQRPGMGEQLLNAAQVVGASGPLQLDLVKESSRVQALIEILCGAAQVDDELDPDESEAIHVELRSLLGLATLTPELQRAVRTFNRARFELVDACSRLRLSDLAHKKLLMRSVRTVLKADSIYRDTERDYFARLGQTLRVAPNDID